MRTLDGRTRIHLHSYFPRDKTYGRSICGLVKPPKAQRSPPKAPSKAPKGVVDVPTSAAVEWFTECSRMAEILKTMEESSKVQELKGHLVALARSISKETMGVDT